MINLTGYKLEFCRENNKGCSLLIYKDKSELFCYMIYLFKVNIFISASLNPIGFNSDYTYDEIFKEDKLEHSEILSVLLYLTNHKSYKPEHRDCKPDYYFELVEALTNYYLFDI